MKLSRTPVNVALIRGTVDKFTGDDQTKVE